MCVSCGRLRLIQFKYGKTSKFFRRIRGALEKGVNNLANALKVTIGPKGRNVVIEKIWSTRYR